MKKMTSINAYHRALTPDDIKLNKHRDFVGGMWEEIGALQYKFLLQQGLLPEHKLVDVGCGCLRGGIHFIDYLNNGNFFGLDINDTLLVSAQVEIEKASLQHKQATLLCDDNFMLSRFKEKFEFGLSISLLTHLPMNMIIRCLKNVSACLAEGGVYYASYFEAPHSAHLDEIIQQPGGIKTQYDLDPFHYSTDEMTIMAELAGMKFENIGDWGHPRNQKMGRFVNP